MTLRVDDESLDLIGWQLELFGDLIDAAEMLEAAGLKIATDDQSTSDYLDKFVKSETVKWAAPIKASGISID